MGLSTWLPQLLLALSVTSSVYALCRVLYNVFLHPLRAYPGPWYRAASRLPYTISIFRGDVTHRVKELHDEYGQVVRITPDTLSYTCSQAWTDIYSLKASAKGGNLPKDPKFHFKPAEVDSMSSADDVTHRRLRRLQSHAFSEKALAMQESYLQQYTDQFISCLKAEAHRSGGVVDMVRWINYLTTDLIGDLSFGESFGGLASGTFHSWLENLFSTLKVFTFIREALRLPPFLVKAAMACVPKHMLEQQKASLAFGAAAAQRRLQKGNDRPDFMSYILRHKDDENGMSPAELEMAAITLIIAGSETTATMMSGTVYLLLSHPHVLRKLASTIRHDFPTQADLVNAKLQQHEYLNAVIKEGLRLYPPVPDYLFRTTKDASAVVAGKVVPPHVTLTVNLWAAHRDPKNFHRPEELLPERWLRDAPAEFDGDDRAVFKPFSAGPRDCLGKNLAWAEMRLILAKMVWSLDLLSLEPDGERWIERQKIYFFWQKLPLRVKLAPRAWDQAGKSGACA